MIALNINVWRCGRVASLAFQVEPPPRVKSNSPPSFPLSRGGNNNKRQGQSESASSHPSFTLGQKKSKNTKNGLSSLQRESYRVSTYQLCNQGVGLVLVIKGTMTEAKHGPKSSILILIYLMSQWSFGRSAFPRARGFRRGRAREHETSPKAL